MIWTRTSLIDRRKHIALSSRRKRPRKRLPRWLPPIAVEKRYQIALVEYVNFIEEIVRRELFPALPAIVNQAGFVRMDDWAEDLDKYMAQVEVTIDKNQTFDFKLLTADIGQKTSAWNNLQWQKTIRAAFGVSLFQAEPWLNGVLKSFQSENLALIKSIKDQSLSSIEANTQRAVKAGMRHEQIAKDIEKTFGLSRNRAKLIGRDQVAKLNGQLTGYRQQEAGVTRYTWWTAGDERVRDNHAKMNGRLCRWDDPTVYSPDKGVTWLPRSSIGGVQLHTGMDYQCRCWAEPDLDEFYKDILEPAAGTGKPGAIIGSSPKPPKVPKPPKPPKPIFSPSILPPPPVPPAAVPPAVKPKGKIEFTPGGIAKGSAGEAAVARTRSASFETNILLSRTGKLLAEHTDNVTDSCRLTPYMLHKSKGATMIHNHPGSSPFSPADVQAGLLYGPKRMVVESADYRYVFEPSAAHRKRIKEIHQKYKKFKLTKAESRVLLQNKWPNTFDTARIAEYNDINQDLNAVFKEVRKEVQPYEDWRPWHTITNRHDAMKDFAKKNGIKYERWKWVGDTLQRADQAEPPKPQPKTDPRPSGLYIDSWGVATIVEHGA